MCTSTWTSLFRGKKSQGYQYEHFNKSPAIGTTGRWPCILNNTAHKELARASTVPKGSHVTRRQAREREKKDAQNFACHPWGSPGESKRSKHLHSPALGAFALSGANVVFHIGIDVVEVRGNQSRDCFDHLCFQTFDDEDTRSHAKTWCQH